MAAQPTLADWGYEDLKVIGRGQYGKAHLVRSKEDTYHIAKTIELTCLSSKERETALQEVALLRRLDHPNIVAYRDNFFLMDTLVIIMQYCEGGDLATYIKDMLKKKTRIVEYQVMHYFIQILQALQYIHHERILHRDLKTSNLFLMKSKSVVKLGDFGISRVLEGSIEAAITVVGTPYYMSPEVCENKPYTFKSDVWSLGCVLYELCVLKHAFSADNLLGLVYKIVSDKYEPIPERYTQQLNTLIQRMLEKNAEKRPSVRELLEDPYVQSFMNAAIDRMRQGTGTPGPNAASSTGPPPRSESGRSMAPSRTGGGLPPKAPGGPSGTAAPAAFRGARAGHRHVRPHGGAQSRGSAVETPKEAALRRKREAADRKAEQLKAAAKQSVHNKTVARQMREAEFQQTRAGGMHATAGHYPVSPSAASSFGGCGNPSATSASGGSSTAVPPSSMAPHPDEDFREEDELDSQPEEISSGYSSVEYEDDFEDEPFSEEDDVVGSDIEEVYMGPGAGVLSMVREEEDLSRVMNNYEQELGKNCGSVSPSPSPSPLPQRTVSMAQAAATAGPTPGGDMRSRASRLKDELMRKMGQDTFEKAYNFLYEARHRGAEERTVKRELEALVGRETYKQYCFDVDQLVFQSLAYGGT